MKISIYVGDLIKERMLSREDKSKLSVVPDPGLQTHERQPTSQHPKAGNPQLRIIQGVWKVLGT